MSYELFFRSKMGRLLRKKSPTKRKKRQDGEALDGGSAAKKIVQGADQEAVDGNGLKSPAALKKKTPGGAGAVSGTLKKNQTSTATPKTGVGGIFDKSFQFLREVKAELKKVTWPPRKQTMGSTVVVIILVMIISFFLGLVDIGLSSLIRVVLQ
jgi:preprotein translocase subunit SecE